jgi:hypothetical protein
MVTHRLLSEGKPGGIWMRTDEIEAAYLMKRINTASAMAGAATNECAQFAHQSLAELYAWRLRALLGSIPSSEASPAPTLSVDAIASLAPSKILVA